MRSLRNIAASIVARDFCSLREARHCTNTRRFCPCRNRLTKLRKHRANRHSSRDSHWHRSLRLLARRFRIRRRYYRCNACRRFCSRKTQSLPLRIGQAYRRTWFGNHSDKAWSTTFCHLRTWSIHHCCTTRHLVCHCRNPPSLPRSSCKRRAYREDSSYSHTCSLACQR